MRKVLILGGSGMLGHALFRYLSEDPSLEVFATVRSAKKLSGWMTTDRMEKVCRDVDIHQTDSIVKVLAEVKPDFVVNCIGIIKQIPGSQDPLSAISTNALLPHRIASLCGAAGVRMIHVSTDCVFDGVKGGYVESDFSNAIDLYGRTKLLGEVAYPHCVTLRTSIIGHELQGNYGLVEWFLGQKEKVFGFRKVIFSGFPTIELARIIRDYVIPNPEMTGLYHVSSNPISKYELLKLINLQYGTKIDIEPEDSIWLDRSLDSSRFRSLTGYNPPTWSELVRSMYDDYLQGPYQQLVKEDEMKIFDNKVIVITGGTGSLGKVLTRRLLTKELGSPKKIIIFSRDEAKQHAMRVEYQNKQKVTDEVIYDNFARLIEFRIGDIRDYHSVCSVLREADIVINAAALKQVPSCEYFPFEAVRTNVIGAENIIRAIGENNLKVETVVGVSTDKACKPVNAMGITKAMQERIFITANVMLPKTRFICVRYGNVLASRGSVIPLFHEQIKCGGPLTITTKEMTRFLLPLESAVDTIFAVLLGARPGEIYIPKIPAARIVDVAKALIEERQMELVYTGIRPGEKVHEVLISEEEAWRAYDRGEYYAIKPMLPELYTEEPGQLALSKEYSSGDFLMTFAETESLLRKHHLMVGQDNIDEGEFLR